MATVSPRGTSCWKTFDDGWHVVCSVCLGIPSLVEPISRDLSPSGACF